VVAIDETAPAGEDVVESAAKELARIAQTTPRDSVQRASAMRANTPVLFHQISPTPSSFQLGLEAWDESVASVVAL